MRHKSSNKIKPMQRNSNSGEARQTRTNSDNLLSRASGDPEGNQTLDARFREHDSGGSARRLAILTDRTHAANLVARRERPMSSDSIEPLIFVGYAHKDEPDPPRSQPWARSVG
jgi:hypothetical protein